jgi:hypothetical protein
VNPALRILPKAPVIAPLHARALASGLAR